MNKIDKDYIIGTKFTNNKGEITTLISYKDGTHVTLEFDDGERITRRMGDIRKHEFARDGCRHKHKHKPGDTFTNKLGRIATLVKYNNTYDFVVRYDDGVEKKPNSIYAFINGTFEYPLKQPINRVGEKIINNDREEMEIIEYFSSRNITIKIGEHIFKNRSYWHFMKGAIKNPYFRDVVNIGYFGEGVYDGKSRILNSSMKLPIYHVWKAMIVRCYDRKYNHTESYRGCTVCDEWHNFQIFAEWFVQNYWEIPNERMHLDKDILIKDNKIYSPNTCILVPQKINNLFITPKKGRYNRGVKIEKMGRYNARLCKGDKGRIFLGSFDTENEAYQAYLIAKKEYIRQMADDYRTKYPDVFPKKVYDAMYAWTIDPYPKSYSHPEEKIEVIKC